MAAGGFHALVPLRLSDEEGGHSIELTKRCGGVSNPSWRVGCCALSRNSPSTAALGKSAAWATKVHLAHRGPLPVPVHPPRYGEDVQRKLDRVSGAGTGGLPVDDAASVVPASDRGGPATVPASVHGGKASRFSTNTV